MKQTRQIAQSSLIDWFMPIMNLITIARHMWTTIVFIIYCRKLPNVIFPLDINEKMFWRKVFDRDPMFITFSDKLAVKDYIKKTAADVDCASVVWRGRDIRQAPNNVYSRRLMFKPNHAAGFMVRLEAEVPDKEALQKKGEEWLKHKQWSLYSEWGYKGVVPELFLEERFDTGEEEILDLNIYTYGDTVGLIIATLGEKTGKDRVGLFDSKGKRLRAFRLLLPFRNKPNPLPEEFTLPVPVDELCETALRLAGGRDHLRVDLMWDGKKLHFCEITIYSGGGFRAFSDPSITDHLTELWDLRKSWFMTSPQSGWREWYKSWLERKLQHAIQEEQT